MTDGPIFQDYLSSAGWPQEASIAAREVKRLFKKDAVPPLTILLTLANDPQTPIHYKVLAAEKAAAYIYPRPADACVNFELGPVDTVANLAAAQARVLQAMATGQAPISMGKALVEVLALMARTLEIAAGGTGIRTLQVVGGLPDLQTEADDPAAQDPAAADSSIVPVRSAG
jgi:hypothetical protein